MMRKTLVALVVVLLCACGVEAAEDPKGMLGFVWGDSISTVKKQAEKIGLESEGTLGDIPMLSDGKLLTYHGNILGYVNGYITFSFYKNELYRTDCRWIYNYDVVHKNIKRALTDKYGETTVTNTPDPSIVAWWVGDTGLVIHITEMLEAKYTELTYVSRTREGIVEKQKKDALKNQL